MTLWRDFQDDMQRLPLDTDTADRLLAGSVLPADAPPGYAGLALFVTTAAEGIVTAESPQEDSLAMLIAAVRSSRSETTPSPRRSSVHRLKLASAVMVAAFACMTGLAFAEGLPGAAQDVASAMLAKVGISVPGPNENAGTHPDVRDQSDVASTETIEEDATASEDSNGKGAEISELATTTPLTGVEKGAAISTLASEGQSQAGQHGQATAEHAAGTETSSEEGAATADTSSQGHSTAGADNGAAGQSHRP